MIATRSKIDQQIDAAYAAYKAYEDRCFRRHRTDASYSLEACRQDVADAYRDYLTSCVAWRSSSRSDTPPARDRRSSPALRWPASWRDPRARSDRCGSTRA